MNEDEAKRLVCRAMDVDRIIHEQVLGLTWSPPPLPFMDHSGPKQPQHTAQQEATQVLGEEDETQDQTERETEQEMCTPEDSGSLESSMAGVDHKPVKRLLELLCDEMVGIVFVCVWITGGVCVKFHIFSLCSCRFPPCSPGSSLSLKKQASR